MGVVKVDKAESCILRVDKKVDNDVEAGESCVA